MNEAFYIKMADEAADMGVPSISFERCPKFKRIYNFTQKSEFRGYY